jgi:hypothetical protein
MLIWLHNIGSIVMTHPEADHIGSNNDGGGASFFGGWKLMLSEQFVSAQLYSLASISLLNKTRQ